MFGNQMKNCSFLHPQFLHLNHFVWEVISSFGHSVSSPDQTPRNSSKIVHCALYFQLSSRCLIWWWNTDCVSCLIFCINMLLIISLLRGWAYILYHKLPLICPQPSSYNTSLDIRLPLACPVKWIGFIMIFWILI